VQSCKVRGPLILPEALALVNPVFRKAGKLQREKVETRDRIGLYARWLPMQAAFMARRLSTEWKLSARTFPEILTRVDQLILSAHEGGVRFRDRKVGYESLVNASLLLLLSQPDPVMVLQSKLEDFEALMDGEEPKLGPAPLPPISEAVLPPLAKKPKGKKKRPNG
jgi:hypothetical protein